MNHANTKKTNNYRLFILGLLLWIILPYSGLMAAEHCADNYYIDETLPDGSRWDMCWTHSNTEGIKYHHIFYTPAGGERRMVLFNASIAQIHVPYDDNGARYHDVSDYGIGGYYLQNLASNECPGGEFLVYSGKNAICKQVKKRGLAYQFNSDNSHGDFLSLYSVSKVGAYLYMPEWFFNDDGTIVPRMHATGALQRFGSMSIEQHGWPIALNADDSSKRIGISHMHNFFWRLDFDLNGTGTNDVVQEINYNTVNGKRSRSVTTFTSEAARSVNPGNMRSWIIKDSAKTNQKGHSISFEILMDETGHREVGPSYEPFTHNDFFVTKSRDCERLASHNNYVISCNGNNNLDDYVNGESINGQDIVVWVGVSFYHMPRSEDAPHMDVHTNHFQIIPRDWHASNPMQTNAAPQIQNPGSQASTVGDNINLAVQASDSNGDSLTWSAQNLPAGLSINTSTGIITGTPTSSAIGTHNVAVTVSDGSLSDTASFTWNISAQQGTTALQNNVAITGISGTQGGFRYYSMDVPAGASNLSFLMDLGSGDPDMYVKFGAQPTLSNYDCRPYESSNTDELCTFSTPQAGTYYIMIHAYKNYSGVSLKGSYQTSGSNNELQNNVPKTGLGENQGTFTHYTMNVPAGMDNLDFLMDLGSGDPDMYVKFGSAPTLTSYDCRPYESANTDELCHFSSPQAGTYYIMIHAYKNYSGVSLKGSYSSQNTSILQNGVPRTGLSGSQGEFLNYTVNLPAGSSNLNILLSGFSGDADLYVKRGSQPTLGNYDCRPYQSANTNETCNFSSPQAGTYYIMIHAYTNYSNATLKATY